MDEKIKYSLKIGIFVLLMIAVLNVILTNSNAKEMVTIEGVETLATGARAFCDSYKGSSSRLNSACGKLIENNCNETPCCVFTNKKCVAGGANGPTYRNFRRNSMNYYFQNKCYGANCPSL